MGYLLEGRRIMTGFVRTSNLLGYDRTTVTEDGIPDAFEESESSFFHLRLKLVAACTLSNLALSK